MRKLMKLSTAILTMAILITTLSTTAFAANPIDVVIKDQMVNFNSLQNGVSMGAPFIQSGRTLVPIRVISENLGYQVSWFPETKTVLIMKAQTSVELKIGNTRALVNGVSQNIDGEGNVKASIKDGRTYVPVRFIAEAMGEKVDYRDPQTSSVYNKTAYINSSNLPGQREVIVPGQINDPVVNQRISEIKNMWSKLKPASDKIKFTQTPSSKPPYILGQLSNETLNDGLNMVNFVRYIAYLPANARLNNDDNELAQAAALVSAVNDGLSHEPVQPAGFDEDLFYLAKRGATTSNLGVGYNNLQDSITQGYMEDGGPKNIDRVGHRRWVLNPTMDKIGFGLVGNYTAMRVVNGKSNDETFSLDYDYISWPAKTAMPIEQFTGRDYTHPWSVSLNNNRYDNKRINEVKVVMVRENDNKKWEFTKGNSNGYFNIDTQGFGELTYTIIFKPSDELKCKQGDKFRVTVSNIYTIDGSKEEVSFETTFFNLEK